MVLAPSLLSPGQELTAPQFLGHLSVLEALSSSPPGTALLKSKPLPSLPVDMAPVALPVELEGPTTPPELCRSGPCLLRSFLSYQLQGRSE